MRVDIRWLAFAAALAAFGCEEKPAPPEENEAATPDSEPLAPTEGKFSIAKLSVRPSQDTFSIEGAPKPEEVQAVIEKKLYGTSSFEKGGPRALDGSIVYDLHPITDGYEVMLYGGLSSANAKFEAGAGYKTTDEQWKDEPVADMVLAAADDLASKLAAQAEVMGSDVGGLIAVLDAESSKDEARLIAIQELRERKATESLPALRKHLDAKFRSELRTAAAATLVQLGDTESRSDIIKVAEDLSRERDPQYVPMLHILADMGGEEVVTYLEAVAEGHGAPAVREVAKEALKEARGGK